MKCQVLFSRKIISICCLLKILPRVLSIKEHIPEIDRLILHEMFTLDIFYIFYVHCHLFINAQFTTIKSFSF